jgi:hypothetical protein
MFWQLRLLSGLAQFDDETFPVSFVATVLYMFLILIFGFGEREIALHELTAARFPSFLLISFLSCAVFFGLLFGEQICLQRDRKCRKDHGKCLESIFEWIGFSRSLSLIFRSLHLVHCCTALFMTSMLLFFPDFIRGRQKMF